MNRISTYQQLLNGFVIGCFFLFSTYFCFGQQLIQKKDLAFMETGHVMKYNFLPLHIEFDLVLVSNENKFNEMLKNYRIKLISMQELQVEISSLSDLEPAYDYNKMYVFQKLKVYELSNGFIAVDNRDNSKANQFYLVKSLRDVVIVANFLHIYYTKQNSVLIPVIECRLGLHDAIKKFMSNTELRIIEEMSTDKERFYLSKEGMCVNVSYVKNSKDQWDKSLYKAFKPFLDKSGIKDSEVYSNLIIFESLSAMKALGIYDVDDDYEVDKKVFGPFSKKIFITKLRSVNVEILDRQTMINLGSKDNLSVSMELDKETLGQSQPIKIAERIAVQYADDLFLMFNNSSDFDEYSLYMGAEYYDDSLSCLDKLYSDIAYEIDNQKQQEISQYIELNITDEGSLEDQLRIIDMFLNEYFFDKKFIRFIFPKLSVFIGNLIIKYEKGRWSGDYLNRSRMILLDSGKEIDIIPHLYTEFIDQKYSGQCSTVTVIGGILIGSKLNIVPLRF